MMSPAKTRDISEDGESAQAVETEARREYVRLRTRENLIRRKRIASLVRLGNSTGLVQPGGFPDSEMATKSRSQTTDPSDDQWGPGGIGLHGG
jgi:hypothetical protein